VSSVQLLLIHACILTRSTVRTPRSPLGPCQPQRKSRSMYQLGQSRHTLFPSSPKQLQLMTVNSAPGRIIFIAQTSRLVETRQCVLFTRLTLVAQGRMSSMCPTPHLDFYSYDEIFMIVCFLHSRRSIDHARHRRVPTRRPSACSVENGRREMIKKMRACILFLGKAVLYLDTIDFISV
jgi:hypothetical protein